jgi:CubicO group peptidase (beta-lactamase class C family)
MDQHWDKTAIAGNEDNIAYLIRYHPPRLFLPREKYEYSNTGYMLLASIAERTSGEDFISLCRKLIFSPLNLRNTDIRTNEQKKQIPNFARGYIFVPGKEKYVRADSFPEFNYTIWLGDRKGPGRISSTASDLLKWDRALYSPRLVKQSTLQKAFTPATLVDGSLSNYGFGWTLGSDDRLGKMVWHTGDNPGYKTEIVRYIDADKTIILLNNNAHQRKAEIMSALKHIVSHHDWQEE